MRQNNRRGAKDGQRGSKPEHLWELHDFFTEKRDETDDKYDYRYSVLILVLARLIKEGWMKFEDLEGIREDKIQKIRYLLKI